MPKICRFNISFLSESNTKMMSSSYSSLFLVVMQTVGYWRSFSWNTEELLIPVSSGWLCWACPLVTSVCFVSVLSVFLDAGLIHSYTGPSYRIGWEWCALLAAKLMKICSVWRRSHHQSQWKKACNACTSMPLYKQWT